MNVNSFQSSLKGHLARASHYDMLIVPPITLQEDFNKIQDLTFRISATNLPGKSIQTTEYKYHGPLRKIPYSYIANDVNITVTCSENYYEREIFMKWQELAHGVGTRSASGWFPGANKRVNYYNEIIGVAEIYNYSVDGTRLNKITLHEVYPLNVNEITLGWDQGGTIATFTCQLAYYSFSEEKVIENGYAPVVTIAT